MPKADFEKNVQEKMQELRFQPSQEVWKRVEAGIAPEKRRRPLVLWLLFAGLVFTGGTYYFITNQQNDSLTGNKSQQPAGQAIAEKQEAKTEPAQEEHVNNLENVPASAENKKPVPTVRAATIPLTKTRDQIAVNKPVKFLPLKPKKDDEEKQLTKHNELIVPMYSTEEIAIKRKLRTTLPLRQNDYYLMSAFDANDIIKEQVDIQSTPIPPLHTEVNKASSPVKKTSWQFGITASGGISDLGEQLLETASGANLFYDPFQSSGGTVARPKPSDVEKGVSFSLGVYTNKTLGKKWKIGLGIGYQYFSNTIKVGEKVDSLVVVNQNSFSMDRVNEYYKSTGNNPYHNQYHFISVPVTVQWQFANKFTWENSLIASRMIKTNALHYDGLSGRYYEADELFNKYQIFASTAVLVGFNKNKIQVGPQLQYAFTNLMKNNTGNPKHLRSVSIKANLELWKN
jgi:hypothetical protein